MIVIGFIIPLIAFFFESYPRFLNRKFGVDIWTHLLYLQEYHKQKGIPKKISGGFIVEGEYDYPPAFITILSRFPFRLVEQYEFLFSPFFDSIHLVLIYFISLYVTQSIAFSLLVQFFYAVTPIIALENSSATPRSLGYTLFSAVLLSEFWFTQTGNTFFLLIAVAAGCGIFLSHRFTTQGFLFFSVFFSLFFRNVHFVGVFVASMAAAVVLSRGFYFRVLRGHIGNLRFWRDVISYRFAHQVKGNIPPKQTHDIVFRLYNQFVRVPPFVLAITNPWVLSLCFYFLLPMEKSAFDVFFAAWVSFSYILSIATLWVPGLRFLGEGQRYLELSAFPAAFIAARVLLYLMSTQAGLVTAVAYGAVASAAIVTIVVIQQKAIIRETLRTITPSMEQMFAYLKNVRTKPKLLCIPHQMTTNTIYHTGCKVFVNADYSTISKIQDVYPYIRLPIRDIMKKYGLDMILLNERYASVSDLRVKNIREIKRFGTYVLLEPV